MNVKRKTLILKLDEQNIIIDLKLKKEKLNELESTN